MYTKQELIDCIYYETSLEILEAIKMIIGNGLAARGTMTQLLDNILPTIEDGKFTLNPSNRMMLRDLYEDVFERIMDGPEDECAAFITAQAKELYSVVIDEVDMDRSYVISDDFLREYTNKEMSDPLSVMLIKSIFYICATNILKELMITAEDYREKNRSLEEFAKIMPETTKEYVRLSTHNRKMIARVHTEIWQWFCSISELEFTDFVIAHSKDFDIAIDVQPVGECKDGEVILYK